MFTKESEWKFLVELLQKEIVKNNFNQELRLFFEQTMLGECCIKMLSILMNEICK